MTRALLIVSVLLFALLVACSMTTNPVCLFDCTATTSSIPAAAASAPQGASK